ncbi:replication protein A 14 kDa subunit B-like isoform X1 [Pistacia vera]|uniref:replication protein A 14 kDa subunit B-like isoform X1 n=1 Tax=Pistacia vera TaxID=55513 RepID=UPI001263526D|nr:replication protein A 14 kDa subunit B-like isoform X1 [Pistacia vera]
MDTSNPAVFVNGGLLRMYVGRRVRTVIQVIQSDSGGVTGKSTDDHQLVVKGSQPTFPLTNFVEVIGIADSDRSIRAEMWTNFGNIFGILSTDQVVTFSIRFVVSISFQNLTMTSRERYGNSVLIADPMSF